MKIAKQGFVFKKNMSIGEVDAENDARFLEECFLDTGDFDTLRDTESPQCIVLGRTGVGKSALLEQLEKTADNTIRIQPEELALRHISNSTVLGFFESLGVDLDIFYSLLWQHTFAVELIKSKYNIDSPAAKASFWDRLNIVSNDPRKQKALRYIEEWGEKFWVDTEARIKEFTDRLEESLKASVGTNIPGLKFTAEAGKLLTEEQKTEVVHYGKKVVNSVQIANLAQVVNLLADDIFVDPQRKTYILIDRLDEGWVEDRLRYKLIRALIETIRKFRSIKTVKIVITLRTDLMERVLEYTRDSGFQREKYNSLFLRVAWGRPQLKQLLDSRINHLLKHQYTSQEVVFDDIFPQKIDKQSSADYLLDRTFLRPRDAIMFVNECLLEAQGKAEITNSAMQLAEKNYSIGRFESLTYEWFVDHPNLSKYLDFLSQKKSSFKVNSISSEGLEALILELASLPIEGADLLVKNAHEYMSAAYPASNSFMTAFRQNLLFVLYRVGAVGIKVDGPSSVRWIHDRTQDLTARKIEGTSIVYVHKMLWRALAIDKSS